MRNARGEAQHDRRVKLLADVQGHADHVLGLLAVARFQAGHAGKPAVVSIVLFVLRAVHVGIVGADEDQPCLQSGHRGVKECVGSHVEADVLHHRHRPAAGVCRANGHVQGDLFVGRPLAVDRIVTGQVL